MSSVGWAEGRSPTAALYLVLALDFVPQPNLQKDLSGLSQRHYWVTSNFQGVKSVFSYKHSLKISALQVEQISLSSFLYIDAIASVFESKK